MALIVPAWGDDKSKDEETLKNATKVLSDMLSSDKVPADVLARADCVIVLPSVKKFGFGVGGSGGRGPMTCRGGKNFSGKWSAPAMYTIGGASFGLQVGGSSTDYVLFIMSQRGLEAMLKGKTKLGNEATAAAGPSGATNAGTVGGTDVLTYARASGLFAGTSLGGATLQADNDANQRLYDKAVNANEIVLQNAVKPTVGGQSLVSLLNTKVTKHQG
jgi:lipid-binding SYLF domain-containing protein